MSPQTAGITADHGRRQGSAEFYSSTKTGCGALATTVTVPEVVVPVTEPDLPDSPAEFVAVTWYEYAVEAVRPLSVYVVPVALPTFVPPRYTLYPVAPEEEFHDSDTELDVVPVTARPVGVGGIVVPPEVVVPVTAPDLADSPAQFVAETV